MSIEEWGWDRRWEEAWQESRREASGESRLPEGLEPGRIIADSRNLFRVAAAAGVSWSRPTGTLASLLGGSAGYPVTGDWVAVAADRRYTEWPLHAVLRRRSALSRRAPTDSRHAAGEQVLAANVDTVFVVCGLDGGRNFTQRGLERALTAAWESGAVPVVVLNKADLAEDRDRSLALAQEVAPGVEVALTSATGEPGLAELAPWLRPGSTVALVGKSGVGKSTIINKLAGSELLETSESRAGDLRGRHTTTLRRLVRLPSGALLMDTPGLREFGLWGDEEAVDGSFSDIAELAAGCRFTDCSHRGEPDCAVEQALVDGSLDPARYESYLALQRELRFLSRKDDVRARQARKEWGKAIARYSRRWHRESGKRNDS